MMTLEDAVAQMGIAAEPILREIEQAFSRFAHALGAAYSRAFEPYREARTTIELDALLDELSDTLAVMIEDLFPGVAPRRAHVMRRRL